MSRSYLRHDQSIKFSAGSLDSQELKLSGLIRNLIFVLEGSVTWSTTASAFADDDVAGKGDHWLGLLPQFTLRLEQRTILKQGSLRDFFIRQAIQRKRPDMANIADQDAATGVTSRTDNIRIVVPIQFLRPLASQPLMTQLDMTRWSRLDLDLQWGNVTDIATLGSTVSASVDVSLNIYSDVSVSDGAPSAHYIQTAVNLPQVAGSTTGNEWELVTSPNLYIAAMYALLYDTSKQIQDPVNIGNPTIREVANGKVDVPWNMLDGKTAMARYAEAISHPDSWTTLGVAAGSPINSGQGNSIGACPIVFGALYEGRQGYDLPTGQANDLRFIWDNKASATRFIRLLEDKIDKNYLQI